MSIPAEDKNQLAEQFGQTAAPTGDGKNIFPPEGKIRIVMILDDGENDDGFGSHLGHPACDLREWGGVPDGLSVISDELSFFQDVPITSDEKTNVSLSDEEAFRNKVLNSSAIIEEWMRFRGVTIHEALGSIEETKEFAQFIATLQTRGEAYAVDVPVKWVMEGKCDNVVSFLEAAMSGVKGGKYPESDCVPEAYLAFIPSEELMTECANEGLWFPVCYESIVNDEHLGPRMEIAVHNSMREALVDLDKGLNWLQAANDLIIGQEISRASLESHGQIALDI